MDRAVLRVRRDLSWVLVAIAATFVPGCTQPNCADYHQPGCWVQPPDASDDADAAGDGTLDEGDVSVDLSDAGAIDEASPAPGD
jgi:hypothetical protein